MPLESILGAIQYKHTDPATKRHLDRPGGSGGKQYFWSALREAGDRRLSVQFVAQLNELAKFAKLPIDKL